MECHMICSISIVYEISTIHPRFYGTNGGVAPGLYEQKDQTEEEGERRREEKKKKKKKEKRQGQSRMATLRLDA